MYNFLHSLLSLFFQFFFRRRITGVENIPISGGGIIAANHVSLWDPPVLGTAMDRKIHFMAKKELFSIPVFSWIITKLNAFPVKRGTADRTAIRTAISLLEQGEIIGVFPEGTRSKTGLLGPAEPGLALIAVKAGVPIIPAAIVGTNQLFSKEHFIPRFRVRFGRPLAANKGETDKEYLNSISNQVMTEIGRLLQEEKNNK